MYQSENSFKEKPHECGTTEKKPVHPLFETFPECLSAEPTTVEGVIPSWVEGALIRLGPGKFEFGQDQMHHWFDGHGIVHRFSIKDGAVTFQSRFVESDAYKANMAAQRITVAEFGTGASPDPCASKFSRLKSRFYNPERSDNVNINIFKHGDVLIANSDAPRYQVLDMNLNTIGKMDMHSSPVALAMSSSHPHFDPDGTMYIAGSSFSGKPMHHIVKIPAASPESEDSIDLLKQVEIVATIPSRSPISPSYCHSFGMTDSYFIYCETPVTMNLLKTLATVVRGKPMNNIFNYDPNAMAVFHLVSRVDGVVLPTKYTIKGTFFWHIINCYEKDHHVVIDLCSLSDFKNSDLFTETLEEFRDGSFIKDETWRSYKHHPLRLVLPLRNTGSNCHDNLVTLSNTSCKAYTRLKNEVLLVGERLLPEGMDRIDMPQINYEKYNGKEYQFFYGTGLFVNQYFMNSLGKVDVKNKTCVRWTGTVNQYPSEPVFVPKPDAESEDDGVILASVCDVDPSQNDFLLVLDAKTFQELGRAYVSNNVRVPYTIHGSFYK